MSRTQITLLALLIASPLAFAANAAAGTSPEPALPWGDDPPSRQAYERAAAVAALGRQMFVDTRLSGSGAISCASCHDPANHFAPANSRPVQPGGANLDQLGTRATPALTYVTATPFFTEHYYESEDAGDESLDQGATGGRTWDGRVNRPRDQAGIPLLEPNEMANESEVAVVEHAAQAPYAPQVRQLYGAGIFGDVHRAFAAIGEALEAYQETPAEFSPFTSKYDAFLRGQEQLTAQETRGLATFNDPTKGNCFSCHRSQLSMSGTLPLFTDYGFIALGVPRNPAIPANADPRFYDLGVCGPLRKDLRNQKQFCGRFKAPSLRNVATRHSFYHNGVFHSLQEAVSFYATRDTNPERWYPLGADGKVRKFDDLPAKFRGNVDTEAPLDRQPGQAPAMSEQDIADIVVFLQTLTDGYAMPVAASIGAGR